MKQAVGAQREEHVQRHWFSLGLGTRNSQRWSRRKSMPLASDLCDFDRFLGSSMLEGDPIAQLRKLKPRELQWFAQQQHHTALGAVG